MMMCHVILTIMIVLWTEYCEYIMTEQCMQHTTMLPSKYSNRFLPVYFLSFCKESKLVSERKWSLFYSGSNCGAFYVEVPSATIGYAGWGKVAAYLVTWPCMA